MGLGQGQEHANEPFMEKSMPPAWTSDLAIEKRPYSLIKSCRKKEKRTDIKRDAQYKEFSGRKERRSQTVPGAKGISKVP